MINATKVEKSEKTASKYFKYHILSHISNFIRTIQPL